MKITELKHLGLSEKEAKVYLATLELGYASVQGIARKAGTNRVAVYQVLDTLKIKGLIDTTYKGKRKVYVATEPNELLNILKSKEAAVQDEINLFQENLLPELTSIFNKAENKPKIKFYDLNEGLPLLFSELENSSDDEIFGVISYSYLPEKYRDPDSHIKEMQRKGKKYKIVSTYRLNEPADLDRFKLFPDIIFIPENKVNFNPKCGIYVNGGKVYIMHYVKPEFLIVIENEAVYDAMKFASIGAREYYKKYRANK